MRTPWPALAATVGITAVVLGPLLIGGGIALRGDMVFTPDQPWKAAWLGLDGSVPRAVPMDALVWLAAGLTSGAFVQRALLVTAFLIGGLGISRLVSELGALGQVAAVVVFLWNPWVHERLAIGQWPMILGYSLLPWLVLAAGRVRDGHPGGWPATTLLLVLTGVCAPAAGLIGALMAAVVVGRHHVLRALCLSLIANLPWIVPALLGPSLNPNRTQFGAFAARGESSLGTVASLLSTGGIWKSSVVPPERAVPLVIGVALLVAVAFVIGFRYAAPAIGLQAARAVAVVAGISLMIALVPAIGPAGDALGELSAQWPAVGMLRDSHRFLAPYGLLLAVGAAALVDRLRGRKPLALMLVVTPILLLPSLAWGLGGALRPVHFPADWDRVAALTAAHEGAVVALPWTGSYRGYGWNDRRAVLDPAARFLPNEVLIDDRVFLRDRALEGEDPYLAQVGRALDSADPAGELRALGVRWVLVEKENGVSADAIPHGEVAFDGRWLRLVDLGAPRRQVSDVRHEPARWAVFLALLVTLSACCVSFWQLGTRWARN